MFGFIIWSFCTVVFLIIGGLCRKADKAVGFWTRINPPEVTDVKKYNNAVSYLWFVFAIILEVIGVPFWLLRPNGPIYIVTILGPVLWAICLMIGYAFIENKYGK